MSTIPKPLATLEPIIARIVELITRLLWWLAEIRPVIVTRRTLDELLDELHDQRTRLERAVDELDAQGGRVLDISGDVTLARLALTRIVEEPEHDIAREIARTEITRIDDRKAERRKARTATT